jgi:hypothetical protein
MDSLTEVKYSDGDTNFQGASKSAGNDNTDHIATVPKLTTVEISASVPEATPVEPLPSPMKAVITVSEETRIGSYRNKDGELVRGEAVDLSDYEALLGKAVEAFNFPSQFSAAQTAEQAFDSVAIATRMESKRTIVAHVLKLLDHYSKASNLALSIKGLHAVSALCATNKFASFNQAVKCLQTLGSEGACVVILSTLATFPDNAEVAAKVRSSHGGILHTIKAFFPMMFSNYYEK